MIDREQLIARLQRENAQLTSDLIRERQRVVQLEDRLSEVDTPIPFSVVEMAPFEEVKR